MDQTDIGEPQLCGTERSRRCGQSRGRGATRPEEPLPSQELKNIRAENALSKRCLNTVSPAVRNKSICRKRQTEPLLPDAPPRKRQALNSTPEADACTLVEELESWLEPEPASEPQLEPEPQLELDAAAVLESDITDKNHKDVLEDRLLSDSDSDVDPDLALDFDFDGGILPVTRNAATEPACYANMTELQTQVFQTEDERNDSVLRDKVPNDDYYCFDWTQDRTNFTGQREPFTEQSGPTFDVTDKTPVDIFHKMFDSSFIDRLCRETNRYAEQKLARLEAQKMLLPSSRLRRWTPTNCDEMISFLAVLILQGLYPLPEEEKYFSFNGYGSMPYFSRIMSYNRFLLLKSLYHFVDNETLTKTNRTKLCKIEPVLRYLNDKFSTLYMPAQEIAIDESLLKWHGRLSFTQKIVTKAAQVGVKTYELCESHSGYLWKFIVYVGKNTQATPTDDRPIENETVDRPDDKLHDRPENATFDRPQGETVDRSDDKLHDRPENETFDRPQGENVNRPQNETVDRPNDKLHDQPENETFDRPQGETVDRPNDKLHDRPENETFDRPQGKTVHRPQDETVDRPDDILHDRPENKKFDRPQADTVNRPQDETVDRPDDKFARPTEATVKIVFDLVEPLLGRGHTITMDDFCNSPLLLRCLKKQRTDCYGTLRLNRKFVPDSLKTLDKFDLEPGEVVASYCPDLSVMVWRDANLVSMISTYHHVEVGIQNKNKPKIVLDYDKSMGGVDRKDQFLSDQPVERLRNKVWYKKVFSRLLNTAVFNAFVIFSTKNPNISHRQFREIMAQDLLKIHKGIDLMTEPRLYESKTGQGQLTGQRQLTVRTNHRPLVDDDHFPTRSSIKKARCWLCRRQKRNTRPVMKCIQCNISLCIEHCFREYHKR